VKAKVDPNTVQGVLRHEDFGTIMQLYALSDMVHDPSWGPFYTCDCKDSFRIISRR